MSKVIVSLLFVLCSTIINAQKWLKSSFDFSIAYVAANKKIHNQLKNEFLGYPEFENKFNYNDAKKAKIINQNYSNNNNPQILFFNFNYVMKRNTNFSIFRNILFTSGININISDRFNYAFSIHDSTNSDYYNKVKGSFMGRKRGLGFNLGISLLSKSFFSNVKFQTEILNSFTPYTNIKYMNSGIFVEQKNNEGRYQYWGQDLKETNYTSGKLMNNTQLKLGLRFNVDCTGNIFINYICNYTIYKGKPDIKYTGFSQGIEFGINFLFTTEESALEESGVFW